MLPDREAVPDFAALGVEAFTTTRDAGSFNTGTPAPVAEVIGRWYSLVDALTDLVPRVATARQVHGTRIIVHEAAWEGWLRVPSADGQVAPARGTALTITVADCVPVFIAHPSGAVALLHSGWRGTAAGILDRGVQLLMRHGYATGELIIHLGPAVCGDCYEVSPEVYGQLTGRSVAAPTHADLRALLAARAQALGVRHITTSPLCTRCHNDRFYSHRAGDTGRQVAVIAAP
ncbi:MAG TPA: polyphenol oxidase family protein [Gemmatimonadaceae bacterium]|nr:polyphenol oxidase family protein [Gemmatimonadaceae bacterium]